MTVAIRADDVSKTYRTKVGLPGVSGALRNLLSPNYASVEALKQISFELEYGQCLGFVGGNGAGKSTLTKILTGIQQPTSGIVDVLGEYPQARSRAFLKQIGVVFGHKTSLWWDLPVRESLLDVQAMYGVGQRQYAENMEFLVEGLHLGAILDRPVRELSLGERVKTELAAQLIHDPRVLFLDEPTVGLDIQSKASLRMMLCQWKESKNTAIFLTSHDTADIDACCDQIMIVHSGRSDFYGSADSLRSKFGIVSGDASGLENGLLAHFKSLDRLQND